MVVICTLPSSQNSFSAELTDNITTDPPLNSREPPLSITGKVGLAVGCLVVVAIIICTSLTLGIVLCFKARASGKHNRHQSNTDTVDRNSQVDDDHNISLENINGPTLTSSNPTVTVQVQHNRHQWMEGTFPGNKHANRACNVSNL